MKIVIATDVFPRTSETFIVAKFLGLLDRGWDAHVVSGASAPAAWEGFPELQARADLHRRVHVNADMVREIEALQPEIIYFPFGVVAADYMDLRDRIGSKIVVSFRGFDLNDLDPDDRDYYQDVWARADLIHLVSHDLWLKARKHGCPATRAHVIIPDAIDSAAFDPGPREHTDVCGTDERPLRILSVGRLIWKKGYEHALQAVKLLVDAGYRCEYRIIGEGDYRPALTFTISDTGLEQVVHLLGARPGNDVRAEMAWADVFLHASVTEGFGVSVIEAQAMALPVVCSDAGGLPENVADGKTGFVTPRRDARALAGKLMILADDPALRQQMGSAGRRRAESLFRLDQQLMHFDALYRNLLGMASAPGRPSAISGAHASVNPLGRRVARLEVEVERLRREILDWKQVRRSR